MIRIRLWENLHSSEIRFSRRPEVHRAAEKITWNRNDRFGKDFFHLLLVSVKRSPFQGLRGSQRVKEGREVLGEIKTNPTLRHIPVIILTSSENEEDILGCYELQANCYVTKSTDLEQFSQTLASLSDFWFRVVRRPVLTKNT